MNTPIVDYVKQYNEQQMTRVHMPGHKGRQFLGCEANDITEIKGADALYEAEGIIHESEKNAASLFGSSRTLYATEGSSQCIRAMLYLAVMSYQGEGRPIVLAARNVHKSFVQAAALVDVDVEWIFPEGDMHSICSCIVNAKQLEAHLQAMEVKPVAVYLTTPDYLGGVLELQTIADICHKYEVLLLVDNAHGAYLKFLEESKHPMDLGVDICCDSAHKTLPVLTGGAYLHLHHRVSHKMKKYAKNAMALFGSTSPSYLTLASLDLCNKYLADGYKVCLKETIIKVEKLRETLRTLDWQVEKTDPLKLTIAVPSDITGIELAEQLRRANVECEYADPRYVVCMFTPENSEKDYQRIVEALGKNVMEYRQLGPRTAIRCKKAITIRNAIFAPHKTIPVEEAVGAICGSPTVACPPAIPIVVSGEVISKEAVDTFIYYGINTVDVVEE